ncbi:MAG: glutamate-1-semialdehyde 2,1-aminomutase [Flavobacteriales bacterium]|jgi:glutamate-1-semialdehyde 2,1-aminomutase
MNFNNSELLYQKGLKHLVGSVNSPVRAFKSVGGNPLFMKRGEGSFIYDVDDNKYIDYVGSYGPMIIGHVHPNVQKLVTETLVNGYSFGSSTENEIILAEIVCAAFPNMDKVRFVNSGTEAVMSAIRLSRAHTGKNKIIKFAGCYHGHSDALLVEAGSGLATLTMPGSSGVTKGAVENTLIARYNDIESVKTLVENSTDIAAIFIEPIAGNMGVVVPTPEFVTELNAIAKTNNILIVSDEVMSGFRSHFGGASELLGLKPDITILGKVIGGGFPVGAYGASNEIMNNVSPLGPMYQAGTLSGNPVAMAGGIATLETLKDENPYAKLHKYSKDLSDGMLAIASKKGEAIVVNNYGAMINPFFTDSPVNNYDDAKKGDSAKFATFFWNMIRNGIYLPPSQYEAWFLNTKMNDSTLNKTLEAFDQSIEF